MSGGIGKLTLNLKLHMLLIAGLIIALKMECKWNTGMAVIIACKWRVSKNFIVGLKN